MRRHYPLLGPDSARCGVVRVCDSVLTPPLGPVLQMGIALPIVCVPVAVSLASWGYLAFVDPSTKVRRYGVCPRIGACRRHGVNAVCGAPFRDAPRWGVTHAPIVRCGH